MKQRNTDDRVAQLFEQVTKKKQEIQKAEKPHWKTHCVFAEGGTTTARGEQINIQVESKKTKLVEILSFLLGRYQFFNLAAANLNVSCDFSWQGYSIEEWQSDIKTRILQIDIKQQKAELEKIEAKLDLLVSPERKRELELEKIEKYLGS